MVGINEADRDMSRFLWFKEPGELNSEIVHLRFTYSSTIRHHLDAQVSEEFPEELIELLKNFLHVDDLVTGEATENAVIELSYKSKKVMQQGGFNLRK